MKATLCCFLVLLFSTFLFCTELRVEIQGDSVTSYTNDISTNTIFNLIDASDIPYSLEYYQEFGTDYLKSFANHTASGLNGWQYFQNFQIGNSGISQTSVADSDDVLLVYGIDFNHPAGVRPLRISTNTPCIEQGTNLTINTTYIAPNGELLLSGVVTLRLFIDEEQYEDYTLQAQNGQILFEMNTPGMYELMINSVAGNDQFIRSNTIFVIVQNSTGISENSAPVNDLHLSNYPNPFNQSTTIRYSLKSDNVVKINIYNVKGQLIKNLLNENQKSGEYKISWDTKNNNNKEVCSGMYFYKMRNGSYTSTKKMILIK